MKEVKSRQIQNCIPTPTSCNEWNGADIPFLGICKGDSLNDIVLEVVKKLQDITQDELANFDIDSLLDICNNKAPNEVTLLSILNLVKDNQICLKDYLDNLSAQITELFKDSKVNVNLRCYAEFDNIGNSLSITREQLDDLIIRNLCNQKSDISTLQGKVTNIQSQLDNLASKEATVNELNISTCVDAVKKPTSSQVISVATAHCNLEDATGTPSDIAAALSKVPSTWNTKYSSLPGWVLNPVSLADVFGNALLVIGAQGSDIQFMQDNCCALSCDDIELGFTAIFNEDMTGVILKFSNGAGTSIPAGFLDKGSKGTIKDSNGNVESFNITIANNAEVEIPITGLLLTDVISININAKIGTDSLICEKCLSKNVSVSSCGVCEITVTGDSTASAVIVYEDDVIGYVGT